MKWVLTGSRPPEGGYTPLEVEVSYLAMMVWKPTDELGTGGCKGWDAIAMQFAHDLGMAVTTFLPKSSEWTDLEAVEKYSATVIHTGVGYWQRDNLEVDWADRVIALPLYERERSSRWSGTWHTWDVARDQRKDYLLSVVRPRNGVPYVRGWQPGVFLATLEHRRRQQLTLPGVIDAS